MNIKIKSVTIPVADQDRALKFYTEKLGYTVQLNMPCPGQDGQRWIELTKPCCDLEIVLFTSPEWKDRVGSDMNIIFESDDLDKTYAELSQKNVDIDKPVAESWGRYSMMRDSEGNKFCIGEHHVNKCSTQKDTHQTAPCA